MFDLHLWSIALHNCFSKSIMKITITRNLPLKSSTLQTHDQCKFTCLDYVVDKSVYSGIRFNILTIRC